MKPTNVADSDETLTASSPADGSGGKAPNDKKIVIFINDVQFKVIEETMTGSQLKTLAGISAANQLFADAPGHQDDPQVLDDVPFALKSGMKFYDVPVGNFGAR